MLEKKHTPVTPKGVGGFASMRNEFNEFSAQHGEVLPTAPARSIQTYFNKKLRQDFTADLEQILVHKATLLGLDDAAFPALSVATRISVLAQRAVKRLPLWAASPVLRLAFGGWPVSARFGAHGKACHMCGAAAGDSLEHLAACPVTSGWAVLVFGPRAPLVLPPSLPGLLGWAVPAGSDDQDRYLLFVLGLWETWTAAKHGMISRPTPDHCDQRLRHCGIRDPKIARLEGLL